VAAGVGARRPRRRAGPAADDGDLPRPSLAGNVLPGMRERGQGSFVLIGSVIGAIAVPQMSPYVASKWAIRSLVRELQLENRDHPGVNITCVTPGSVDKPIYLQAANYDCHVARPPPAVVSPERAAGAVLRAIDRPRRTVDVGAANRVMRAGVTLLPRVFDALVGPLFSVSGRDRAMAAPGPGNVFESQEPLNRVHGEQGSTARADCPGDRRGSGEAAASGLTGGPGGRLRAGTRLCPAHRG